MVSKNNKKNKIVKICIKFKFADKNKNIINIQILQRILAMFEVDSHSDDSLNNDTFFNLDGKGFEGNIITTNKQDILEEQINKKNDLNKKHFDSTKCEETKNEKKRLGRKKKLSNERDISHNKYSDDNVKRKIKHLNIKNVYEFINNKIKTIYNGNIGNGIFKKELKTLNQSQKLEGSSAFNKIFLTKTLAEIFSEKISSRFTNFPRNHNKLLIEQLMNETDENKKEYFNKLFNITFIQCLNHFCGKAYFNELEGLKSFHDLKNDIIAKYPDDGDEYFRHLEYYLNNFETIVNNKRERNSYKKVK